MRYLGKRTGHYPSEDYLAAMVDSVLDEEIDLFTGLGVSRYTCTRILSLKEIKRNNFIK